MEHFLSLFLGAIFHLKISFFQLQKVHKGIIKLIYMNGYLFIGIRDGTVPGKKANRPVLLTCFGTC